MIRDTDSLVRAWYPQASVVVGSPGESVPTQTLAGSELAAPYSTATRVAQAPAITQFYPNSYGINTPQPVPHFLTVTQTTQETLTITQVLPSAPPPTISTTQAQPTTTQANDPLPDEV
ncbi:hypothetical protein P691DRAFT_144457 [Macrolepiota fuliginosa MF-IS2]|uniref:Uncharacterized protein n=1 Tax=Macrolepiota fuliginosa MF-IS2 TaxID=1400762 RepID=A0A9P6C324_9AGAR|nr:hypothetical protein P691DRAFT_144457 [Macrolepiota fuliginosa MF-IS2]